MVIYEWDENKNQANIKKHGVSFEEPKTVFEDKESILFNDESHSDDEERFLLIGFSFKLKLLFVCHCYRENETVIRIISARKVTKLEAKEYGKN